MKRTIAAAVAGLGIVSAIGIASPAFASSAPGSLVGTVTVPTSITLTESTGTFSMNVTPGTTGTTSGITGTVDTNDSAGYTFSSFLDDFSHQNGFDAFTNGGNQPVIPDTAWSINGTQFGPASGTTPPPVTLGTTSGPSAAAGDVYNENLSVAVPGNQPAATYSGTVNFLAVAS